MPTVFEDVRSSGQTGSRRRAVKMTRLSNASIATAPIP